MRRAGRGDQGGPGEGIKAARGSEWGARRAAGGDRGGPGEAIEAGSEWGARRAAGGDRGEPGEATEAGSEWGVWIPGTTLQASGIHSQVNYYHMQADGNHPLPILVRMVFICRRT